MNRADAEKLLHAGAEVLAETLGKLGDKRSPAEHILAMRTFLLNEQKLKKCPRHFFHLQPPAEVKQVQPAVYACKLCGGTVGSTTMIPYLTGARHAGGELSRLATEEVLERCGFA